MGRSPCTNSFSPQLGKGPVDQSSRSFHPKQVLAMNSFIYVFFFLALISGVAQAGEIEAKLIFKALLKLSGINDVDVDSCLSILPEKSSVKAK